MNERCADCGRTDMPTGAGARCPLCLMNAGADGLEDKLGQLRDQLGGLERRKTAIEDRTRAAGAVAQAVAGLAFCPVCRAEELWEDRECCPTGVAVGAWEAASVMEAVAGE
ncbi:MAG TPA: hypothetical protein VM389_14610 [Phycisphaerae bacterium]|nr:hypothetical protein [Phycisphaerae bacterium]HUU58858.1 hypothetical protein [Phycisphaerae bacterium]